MTTEFTKKFINTNENIFESLTNSVKFENITKGRLGCVLIDKINNKIPIVRTTTKYNEPAQQFQHIHYDIIKKIINTSQISNINFNNILCEMYNHEYCTMGLHSDQSLDLDYDSYICIYSCYNTSNPQSVRTLRIRDKNSDKKLNHYTDITLDHNSIVFFSVKTNQNFLHQIILQNNTNKNDVWLGLTLRLSKTFICFNGDIPYFYATNMPLRIASQEETKEFYRKRSEENKKRDFEYPFLDYTISNSDLMKVI